MKLMLVTDAWHPQVNGVVRTLTETAQRMRQRGWDVRVVGPTGVTFPCPTYPEIRLTMQPYRIINQLLETWTPDAIHIATEGPLGIAARSICLRRDWAFTTSFHTRFPEYLNLRLRIPSHWTYGYIRWFHEPASRTLVPTKSIQTLLRQQGILQARVWGRGVDVDLFNPSKRVCPRLPTALFVGRLAVEKNIDAFLNLRFNGTKMVVGDGPERERLQREFPDVIFTGPLFGNALAEAFASADVFVFPSKTDTFGLVLLEALASGTPVAAYPVPGPLDVLLDERVGAMDECLQTALDKAILFDREECRAYAERFSWEKCVDIFENSLVINHPEQWIRPTVPVWYPSERAAETAI